MGRKQQIHLFYSMIFVYVLNVQSDKCQTLRENSRAHSFRPLVQLIDEAHWVEACIGKAETYVGLVGWDVFLLLRHVVPINSRPGFDFLPLHAGNACQLRGFAEDRFCCRRHVDTHGLANADWKGGKLVLVY